MTQAPYKFPIDCSINNDLMKYLHAERRTIGFDGKNPQLSKLTSCKRRRRQQQQQRRHHVMWTK